LIKFYEFYFILSFRTLLAEFNCLSNQRGDWRLKRSKEIGAKVQKHFHDLQNPKDCSNARTLICDLNKACGFGCQMHHAMYCFIESFFQNRTMILESHDWRYDSKAGYEGYFLPVSETCSSKKLPEPASWNGMLVF
jgi:glycoprotein 6-alpha-L-fucosyltransferase